MIALFDAILVVLVHILHNAGGLVADDNGVGGHVHVGPPIGGHIRPADAGRHYLNNGIAFLSLRLGQLYHRRLTGALNLNTFHINFSLLLVCRGGLRPPALLLLVILQIGALHGGGGQVGEQPQHAPGIF